MFSCSFEGVSLKCPVGFRVLFKFYLLLFFSRCLSSPFCVKVRLDLKEVLFKGKLLETQVCFIEESFVLYKAMHRLVKIDVGLKAVPF